MAIITRSSVGSSTSHSSRVWGSRGLIIVERSRRCKWDTERKKRKTRAGRRVARRMA